MSEEAHPHPPAPSPTGQEKGSLLDTVAQLLIAVADPESIILFGSYARGDYTKDSDLDLLVILPTVEDRVEEMARLRMALWDVPMAIDVVVFSRDEVEERQHLRGTMLFHAVREGQVLYDAIIFAREPGEC
jgi:predicted nucleotidyltransferase